jgi:hypothetical protein
MKNRSDVLVFASLALPAAGATAYTNSIEVGGPAGFGQIDIEFGVPATPSLVDAKTITLKLQHSVDDGANFIDVPELSALVVTGAGGVGGDATSNVVTLPPATGSLIRVAATVLAAGGSNIAVNFYGKGRF